MAREEKVVDGLESWSLWMKMVENDELEHGEGAGRYLIVRPDKREEVDLG